VNSMNILAPSILSADFWKLGEDIASVEEAGCPYLHIDVMDGNFVPCISYGMPVIESIRKKTDLFFDVHLMIDQPERYVEEFARCGADLIDFHLESTKDPERTIRLIRKHGKKVGIAIKPYTAVSALKPYLHLVDMVLIMTVIPGFGGQSLMPECLEKVKELRALLQEMGLEMDVQVDGGIKADNVHLALEAGANVIVAGSAVFKNDIKKNVHDFHKAMNV